MLTVFASSILLTIFSIRSSSNALNINYYNNSCPNVESLVTVAVKKAIANDGTVPAALLRMHFHDCFIRGCDGSVLLNSTQQNSAEKDGPPNISLHAFYVIDRAKKAVESSCPGVVSCADILALAARDAVALICFAQRGLSIADLVALSGGHTLGFAHCSSFQNRIHNFNQSVDVDPSLSSSFAVGLRKICPAHNKVRSAGAGLDSTATIFDNAYFKLLLQGKSLFSSDQALLTNPRTKQLITQFASSQAKFNAEFVKSMVKMGSLKGGKEVRLDCRFVR
ncbi:peroxidase 64 [Dendrobium catenatum]|uniref:peroxidase 64 n=1 Tax=Dendrobium catenatum TaxID=906689 RepID=UPI00109F9913|nr:peroxidase 64 [Dendrobium catenatum]